MCSGNVYSQLKGGIKALMIPPGAPIVIGQLSEALGVSHIPVREALGRLAAEGHINYHRGHGFCMRHIDIKALRECFGCLELTLNHAIDQFEDPMPSRYREGIVKELSQFCCMWCCQSCTHEDMADLCEKIMFTLLRTLDNRYLIRAAQSAIEQIYFLLPATCAHPTDGVQLQEAVTCFSGLLLQNRIRAKALVSRVISEGQANVEIRLENALYLARQRAVEGAFAPISRIYSEYTSV